MVTDVHSTKRIKDPIPGKKFVRGSKFLIINSPLYLIIITVIYSPLGGEMKPREQIRQQMIDALEHSNSLEDLTYQRSLYGPVLQKSFPMAINEKVDLLLSPPQQLDVLNEFKKFLVNLIQNNPQLDMLGAIYNVSGAGKTKVTISISFLGLRIQVWWCIHLSLTPISSVNLLSRS